MCKSRILFKKVLKLIKDKNIPLGDIEITVPKKLVSPMIGQKRANIEALKKLGYNAKIVEGEELSILKL